YTVARKYVQGVFKRSFGFPVYYNVADDRCEGTNEQAGRDGYKTSCRCDRYETNNSTDTKTYSGRLFATSGIKQNPCKTCSSRSCICSSEGRCSQCASTQCAT